VIALKYALLISQGSYRYFLKLTDSILLNNTRKSLTFNWMHYGMLYPQNGDRIMTIDSVASLHTMYKLKLGYIMKHQNYKEIQQWIRFYKLFKGSCQHLNRTFLSYSFHLHGLHICILVLLNKWRWRRHKPQLCDSKDRATVQPMQRSVVCDPSHQNSEQEPTCGPCQQHWLQAAMPSEDPRCTAATWCSPDWSAIWHVKTTK